MKRRSFLKGLLATPFVAKAILAEEPKPAFKPKNAEYTPEIKTAMHTERGMVRDMLDTQRALNERESMIFNSWGKALRRKAIQKDIFTGLQWDSNIKIAKRKPVGFNKIGGL